MHRAGHHPRRGTGGAGHPALSVVDGYSPTPTRGQVDAIRRIGAGRRPTDARRRPRRPRVYEARRRPVTRSPSPQRGRGSGPAPTHGARSWWRRAPAHRPRTDHVVINSLARTRSSPHLGVPLPHTGHPVPHPGVHRDPPANRPAPPCSGHRPTRPGRHTRNPHHAPPGARAPNGHCPHRAPWGRRQVATTPPPPRAGGPHPRPRPHSAPPRTRTPNCQQVARSSVRA